MKYTIGASEKIHVSDKMSGKMKGIDSLSTSAVVNPLCKARCNNERSVCAHCFACATIKRYKELGKNLENNYRILNSRVLLKSEANCVRFTTALGRIESFGDVASVEQARNYLRIARANRQSRFGIWTKNPWLWDEALRLEKGKPANVTMVLSSVMLNEPTEDYKKYDWVDYVFTVYEKKWLKENKKDKSFINCGARSCLTCQQCYKKHRDGQIRFINELRK